MRNKDDNEYLLGKYLVLKKQTISGNLGMLPQIAMYVRRKKQQRIAERHVTY